MTDEQLIDHSTQFERLVKEGKIHTSLKDSVDDLYDQVRELQASGGRISETQSGGMSPRSALHKMFSDWVKEDYANISKLANDESLRYHKVVGTMTTTTHLTGDVFHSQFDRMPPIPAMKMHVRDLVPIVGTATGSVKYPKEVRPAGEGSFAQVSEGSAKPQLDFDIVMADLAIDYIAGYTTVSRVMLQDLPFLQSYLSRKLTDAYLKAEDAYFFPQIAFSSITGTTSETETVEKILDYLVQLENSGYSANAIVITPTGWRNILSTAPADYSTPAGVRVTDSGTVTIAGVPVFKSTQIQSGKVFVGDWTQFNIAMAEGFNIKSSEHHNDNFTKNLITFRGEARADLLAYTDYAMVYGNI